MSESHIQQPTTKTAESVAKPQIEDHGRVKLSKTYLSTVVNEDKLRTYISTTSCKPN